MASAPLVSILMTAYNREKYIAEAIESVLRSTYKDFEFIIVDDDSKDKTVEIARCYAAKDPRIKLYINKKNVGDYPNRNIAASYATGKYLKYVDSDDYIYPWGLEVMVKMMEQHPNAGWGLCTLLRNTYINRPFPIELDPKKIYEYEYFGPGLFSKAPVSSIIRRDVFEKYKGFRCLRMVGDCEMWHRLAQYCNVLLMPDGIIWYREHDDQEMKDYKKYYKNYEEIKLKYLYDANCPLNHDQVRTIIEKRKRSLLRQILFYTVTLDFQRCKESVVLLLFNYRYKQ